MSDDNVIFKCDRRTTDAVHIYPTLECVNNCRHCSGDICNVSATRRAHGIDADLWLEGLRRTDKPIIITGGEPFLYYDFIRLIKGLSKLKNKVKIYTTLMLPVEGFIKTTREVAWDGKEFEFVISGHSDNWRNCTDKEQGIRDWIQRIRDLQDFEHDVEVCLVDGDVDDYVIDRVRCFGIPAIIANDQNKGMKSSGQTNPEWMNVHCTTSIFLYGPLGQRFQCVRHLNEGVESCGTISDGFDNPITNSYCELFGHCCGCDNMANSTVTKHQ